MNLKNPTTNKSGVKGVYWDKKNECWATQMRIKDKRIWLGRYKKLEDAIKARRNAEEKYQGEYSYDNSIKILNKE